MRFAKVAETTDAVRATRSRTQKIAALADCLSQLSPDEAEAAAGFLSGELRQPKLGVGYATLRTVTPPPAPEPGTLSVLDVDGAFDALATTSGRGSAKRRGEILDGLLAAATDSEQRLLRGLIVREVRQGALEGVLTEAVARAAEVDSGAVRRAVMLAGDVRLVAAALLRDGEAALDEFRLTLFRPLQPMLAQPAEDLAASVGGGPVFAEYKLDGARVQVHRLGSTVEVYTRNLRTVTSRVPEIVADVGDLRIGSAILDGEAIALDEAGRPRPFQETMGRFGTESDESGSPRLPLRVFFFDVLHLDGIDLIDRPATERIAAMERSLPRRLCVERALVTDADQATSFFEAALAAGHEGVVIKDPEAPYAAGRRGAAWQKVKPVHTLDLVVLAAEWGSGRRTGHLSNLHLGARDPAGGYVMLGKTFKGLTDAMLRWQTEQLLALEAHRSGHVVHVRPQLVVEIAFDGVQSSSRYPGGMALRFARVKGYRPDKEPIDADTIDTVRAIHTGDQRSAT